MFEEMTAAGPTRGRHPQETSLMATINDLPAGTSVVTVNY